MHIKRQDTQSDAIYSFGQSENVNSINWFPTRTKQLVVGMSGKYLRIFDLRSNYSNDPFLLDIRVDY